MYNKKAIRFFAVILAITLMVPLCNAAKKYEIKLKLKEGKTYNHRITTDQKIAQDMHGTKQTIDQTITFDLALKVEKIEPAGDTTTKIKFSAINLKQATPMGPFEYDSSKPSDTKDPAAKAFASMMGQELTVVLTKDGTTKSISGLDDIKSKIIKDAKVPEGAERNTIEQTIEENFGDETVQGMMENFVGNLPEKPVSIGDTWTGKAVTTEKFPMVVTQTYTLKDVKDGKAFIDTKGIIKSNPDVEPFKMGPISMKMEISGEQHGTIEVALKTGLTVGGELKQDITGKIIMTNTAKKEPPKKGEKGKEKAAPTPESITVPMTINSVIKLSTF